MEVGEGRGGEWVNDVFPCFLDLLGDQQADADALATSIRTALHHYVA
jgi:hypothetical protein